MRLPRFHSPAALLFLLALSCTTAPEPRPAAPAAGRGQGPKAPIARREPVVSELHGVKRVDDYVWLHKKGAPEVEAYLQAENAHTDEVMKPTRALQETLYREMVARLQQTDVTVPYPQAGWLYYSRTEEGKNYPVLMRRRSETAPEQVILDLNALSKMHKFVGLGDVAVSDDGHLLAYTLDTTGFRQYMLYVKDLRTGELRNEGVPRVTSVAWAADNQHLFYTVEDDAKRAYRAYRHKLGQKHAQDTFLYEEKDARFDVDFRRTRSGAYVVLDIGSLTTSESHVLEASRPTGALRLIASRIANQQYRVDHAAGRFFIVANDTGRNFRLVSAPLQTPDRPHWKEVVPHRADVMLKGVDFFQDFYVRQERRNGLPSLWIGRYSGDAAVEVPVSEPVYELTSSTNAEFKTRKYRYTFSSLVTPPSVFEYDVDSKTSTLLKRQPVRGGYDASQYVQERLFAPSADGVRVPISLVRRKSTPKDGSAPLVLVGYGAYGHSLPVSFNSDSISLLDRGVILATAHVRGGGELGKAWHDDGRMMKKKNTFADFVASAEFLIAENYTRKERLAIRGISAGGLLIGYVTNNRPDLFRAVIADVPFVDLINTMLDESLPLTVNEFEEWGNPKDKAAFEYMLSYSPYDNVDRRAYPAMLVQSAYNDSQVMYFEPTKWVAKLRVHKTDTNPLLLRMLMEPAGHLGRSGRYDQLREVAFSYAFILSQLGVH